MKKYGSDVIIVRRTKDAEADLIARVGMDRNVLVLTDNDPRSFLPLQALSRTFRSRRIHLFACLPFSYESSRRKREILELLGDLSMVKSLCLIELDQFLNESEKEETLGGLQLRIRNGLIGLIDRAVAAMEGLDEFTRYRYDPSTDTYQENDLLTLQEELQEKLLAKRGTGDGVTSGHRETSPISQPGTVLYEPTGDGSSETASSRPDAEFPAGTSKDPEAGTESEPGAEAAERETSPIDDQETSLPHKKRRSLFAFLRRRKE